MNNNINNMDNNINNMDDNKPAENNCKLNILVADTAPLYPPLWGGPLRIYELYSNFSNSDITYVGVNINKGFQGSDRNIGKGIKEVVVPPDKKFFSLRKLQFKYFKGLTFDLYTYLLMKHDRNFCEKIRKEGKGKQVLISSHVWSFPCLKRANGEFLVYDSHNVEYQLMKQITKGKPFGKIVSHLVKNIEKKACRKSDLIIACSEGDKKSLMELYGINDEKVHVIPNSTNLERFPDVSSSEKEKHKKELNLNGTTVFFVGAYYNPNIEALKFIVNELAPKLPDCTFLVAGSIKNAFCEFSKEENLPKNIVLYGSVSDPELKRIIAASDIAIAPMFSGSGIQIKMLDYMAAGLPIVTTQVGARGLGLENKKHALICDSCDSENFASEITRLINDKILFEELKSNAKAKVAEFDSKLLGKKFEEILMSKVNGDLSD